MFKQFDVNYNSIVIDGITIDKPKSVSVVDWDDFWGRVKLAINNDSKIYDYYEENKRLYNKISDLEDEVSSLEEQVSDLSTDLENSWNKISHLRSILKENGIDIE